MKVLLWPFRLIYCVYAIVIFIILMMIVFPVAIIGAMVKDELKGGNIVYNACRLWADVWLWMMSIRHQNIYEAPHDPTQQFIFVANHISYLDIPILVKTIQQPIRVLGKAEMKKVPIFGFIYKNAIVTVNRSNTRDRAKSILQLKNFIHRGISIFIFPEGTFNLSNQPLAKFYDGAFRLAIETQTPVKPILILDSYKLMHYSTIFSLIPGKSRSVFLEPISVEGYTLDDIPHLKTIVYQKMEEALIRWKADWIK